MDNSGNSHIKNMSLLLIICLMLQSCTTNPVSIQQEDNTFYGAIVKQCPNLNLNDATYRNQDIFKRCHSWQEISKTKELSAGTEQNVKCLLYYESFVSYCTQLNISAPNTNVTLVPEMKNYVVTQVCENMSLFGNVGKLINSVFMCYKICMNFDKVPAAECGLAYYFAKNAFYLQNKTKPIGTNTSLHASNQSLTAANPPKLTSEAKISPANTVKSDGSSLGSNGPQKPETNSELITNAEIVSKNSQPGKLVSNTSGISTSKSEKAKVDVEPSKTANHNVNEAQADTTGNQQIQNTNSDHKSDKTVGESAPAPGNQQNSLPPEKSKLNNDNKVNTDSHQTAVQKGNEQISSNQPEQETDDFEMEEQAQGAGLTGDQETSADQQKPETGSDKEVNIEQKTAGATGNQPNSPNQQKVQAAKQSEDVHGQIADHGDGEPSGPGDSHDGQGNYYDQGDGDAPEHDKSKLDLDNAPEKESEKKPSALTETGADFPSNYNTIEDLDGESNFFSYFMVVCVLFVLGYVGYHNRQKVVAIMLEGKRGKRQTRSRRPNSANYHKLDSNLEEAISSTCTKNSTHVIY